MHYWQKQNVLRNVFFIIVCIFIGLLINSLLGCGDIGNDNGDRPELYTEVSFSADAVDWYAVTGFHPPVFSDKEMTVPDPFISPLYIRFLYTIYRNNVTYQTAVDITTSCVPAQPWQNETLYVNDQVQPSVTLQDLFTCPVGMNWYEIYWYDTGKTTRINFTIQ